MHFKIDNLVYYINLHNSVYFANNFLSVMDLVLMDLVNLIISFSMFVNVTYMQTIYFYYYFNYTHYNFFSL